MHCHDGDLVVQLARVGDVLAALGEQLGVGQARGHFGSSLAARASLASLLAAPADHPGLPLWSFCPIRRSASTSLTLRSRSWSRSRSARRQSSLSLSSALRRWFSSRCDLLSTALLCGSSLKLSGACGDEIIVCLPGGAISTV